MKIEIKKLIKIIIYILMGLQIGLGVWWIGCNFPEIPRFEETRELITMSETLEIDEYTGILYPVLLRGTRRLGEWTGIPYGAFLYFLQLAMAGGAYVYLLKQVCGKLTPWKAVFFAGFLITIPTLVQCHMAVLPYSLASSAFCIVLGMGVRIWRREQEVSGKALAVFGGAWVISALLCPAYLWFGGFLVGSGLVYFAIQHRDKLWRLGVLLLAGILCVHGAHVAFRVEGCTGKIQKSVGAMMVARIVWPNFTNFYYFWGEEIKQVWDYDSLARMATYPECVIYEFGPQLELAYGREEANRMYWEMTGQAISLDTKKILLRLGLDATAYICPPLTMLVQLQGVDVSYTGWNYGRMKDYAPGLTGYYVDYALHAWVAIGILEMVYAVLSRREKKLVADSKGVAAWFVSLLLVVDLWYVMVGGHMQDYKRLMLNSILWGILMLRYVHTRCVDK